MRRGTNFFSLNFLFFFYNENNKMKLWEMLCVFIFPCGDKCMKVSAWKRFELYWRKCVKVWRWKGLKYCRESVWQFAEVNVWILVVKNVWKFVHGTCLKFGDNCVRIWRKIMCWWKMCESLEMKNIWILVVKNVWKFMHGKGV